MDPLPPITLRLRGRKVVGRVAFTLLLLGAIAVGAVAGLLFVYSSDLPQIRALEDFQPDVVTELYADDGQLVGNFALQRRVLLTYEQIPPVLKDAILTTEDQHFEQHWGVDFTRVAGAAWKDPARTACVEGASTITMQLAGTLFLDRSDRSMGRKIQEALLAIQIERHYSKQQIFTMYCNQIYLSHGNYGFEAASEYYFGKPVGKLTLPEAALLAGLIRGPSYSPILHAQRALARRNLVLELHGAHRQNHGCAVAAGHRAAAGAAHRGAARIRWRRILSKKSANIWKAPMARKWCTSAACACTRRSTSPCSGRQPAPFATACTPTTAGTAGAASWTTSSRTSPTRWTRMKTMTGAGPSTKATTCKALVTAVDQKAATIKIGSLSRRCSRSRILPGPATNLPRNC